MEFRLPHALVVVGALAAADIAIDKSGGTAWERLDAFGLLDSTPARAMEVIQETYEGEVEIAYKDADGDGDKEWCLNGVPYIKDNSDIPYQVDYSRGNGDWFQRSADGQRFELAIRSPFGEGQRLYATIQVAGLPKLENGYTLVTDFYETDPRIVTQTIGERDISSPDRSHLAPGRRLP